MAKLVMKGLLVAGLVMLVAIVWAVGAYARPAAAGGGHRSTPRPYAGRAEAFRLRSRTSGGTDVVYVYMESSTAVTATVGIYTNTHGRPGVLLSTGSESRLKARAWSAVAVTPVRLIAGRTYWLAVLGEDGTSGSDRSSSRSGPRRGPCLSSVNVQTHLSRLPRWWRTRGMRARTHCPIAAYLLAGGAVGSPVSPGHGPGETMAPNRPASEPSAASPAVAPSPEGPPSAPPAPVDIVAPAIGGPVIVGEQLSASPGTWTGSPTSYAYQWESCDALGLSCLSVSGATSSSYTLTPSDLADTMRVVVTASNAGGATIASSPPTGPVVPAAPTNEAPPTIDGTAEAGEQLSASPGTWTGSPTSYAYQWEDCNSAGEACSEVSGATSASYELTASDVGHTIVVVVTASNASGSTPAASQPSALVAAEQTAPTNEAAPSISGSALVGERLSASHGTWTGSPTSYAYQWEDCNAAGGDCSEIAGAKSQTYTLIAGDVEHTIRVVVTASNSSGPTQASSEATAVVVAQTPAPPTNEVAPVISGSAVEDQTLTASHGTWSGSPTSYAYQWEDCNAAGKECEEISGATSSSHKLTGGDVMHTMRVVVKATNAGGTGKATSAATGTVVAPAPTNTALPTIGGSTVEGETLSAGKGTWTGSPTSYAYQWEECSAAGEACADVSGATASDYVLPSSDVGHTIRVVVTASNAGGHNAAMSAATSVVTAKEKTGTPKNCFENPETEGTSRFEACGYPGPKNTGVGENGGKTECSALPKSASGNKTITKAETIENTDITGQVTVAASGVTLDKDCIVYDGHEGIGSSAVILEGGASDFTITNTTVRAENDAADSFEEAVSNDSNAAHATASKDRFEDCGECLHQEWTLTKSYVIANGQRGTEEADEGEIHREDWYCNNNTVIAEGNTMLNPYEQTAIIFCDTNLGSGGACSDRYTVRENLLAGAGYMLYPCGNASSAGTSTSHIEGNRFARCLGARDFEASPFGGTKCTTGGRFPTNAGADTHGYWPEGGYFGVLAAFYTGSEHVWSGNYWDNNLETAAEP